MAEESPNKIVLVWTPEARLQWRTILEFFNERNGSPNYSIKLDLILARSLKLLCLQPELGEVTDMETIRCHTVGNYAVFYRIVENAVEITTIRDARRKPED